jgi:hypothetical protein
MKGMKEKDCAFIRQSGIPGVSYQVAIKQVRMLIPVRISPASIQKRVDSSRPFFGE